MLLHDPLFVQECGQSQTELRFLLQVKCVDLL